MLDASYLLMLSDGSDPRCGGSSVSNLGDPPIPPLKRGENPVKVPLFKGDARGISTDINEANKV
jgi:hypothetical protein